MELVFENGQILAKSQRSILNQRTESIMDLYEAEYNDDFKNSIKKNLRFTQAVQEHHDVVESYKHENIKKMEFIPPDEQSMVAERSVEYSSTDFSEESEGSTYLNSSLDDDVRQRVPTRTRESLVRRKRTSEVYNSLEEKQRNDINKKMRTLQDLLPNFHKDDKETLLDETINYMTTLQHQVEMMKMSKSYVTPSFPLPHYSQMGMQMVVPQFIHASVPVLPGLIPMQNLSLFSPMENHFPQYVPPSCVASPNYIPNSTRNQGTLRDGGRILSWMN